MSWISLYYPFSTNNNVINNHTSVQNSGFFVLLIPKLLNAPITYLNFSILKLLAPFTMIFFKLTLKSAERPMLMLLIRKINYFLINLEKLKLMRWDTSLWYSMPIPNHYGYWWNKLIILIISELILHIS